MMQVMQVDQMRMLFDTTLLADWLLEKALTLPFITRPIFQTLVKLHSLLSKNKTLLSAAKCFQVTPITAILFL